MLCLFTQAWRDFCETCRRYLDGFPPETRQHLRTRACNGIRADFTRFSGSTISLPRFCARGMRKGDEKDMSRIHLAAFHFPNLPREYLRWATSSNCRTTLAVLHGQSVGFLTAEKRPYCGYGDFNIALEPEFHGRGLGSALMESGLNDLIEMGCNTAVADFWLQNAKVQALNRKYSFRIVRAYNYYETEAAS